MQLSTYSVAHSLESKMASKSKMSAISCKFGAMGIFYHYTLFNNKKAYLIHIIKSNMASNSKIATLSF